MMMLEHDAIAVAVSIENWDSVAMQELVSYNLSLDQLQKGPDLSPMLPESVTVAFNSQLRYSVI